MRIVIAAIAVLALSACGIPRQAVLTFKAEPQASQSYQDIPAEWKGRLIRVRSADQPNEVGGSASHVHQLAHQHRGESLPTTELTPPLGIRNVTADATHRHLVESLETAPADTQPSDHSPLAFGLDAVVVVREIRRPVEGLIVGFLGNQLPTGWHWCDGQNGTPDLRDRFILLDSPAGPSGAADHAHQAPHSHRWATADNVDHPGYFGDPATPVDPILNAAQRVHRHAPGASISDSGTTSPAPNSPPAVGMRFIMAGPGARKLPDGIVVAYAGRSVPQGWQALEGPLSSDILGRFWRAENPDAEATRLSGTESHDHVLRSRHEFELAAGAGSAGRDRTGQGPGVPVANHRHRVMIEEDSPVAATQAVPRYVALRLIVKN